MIIVRQRYYSNLGLKQRNYNIITDIRHSGIRRAYKKQVGRARRKITEGLNSSIEKDKVNYKNAIINIKNREPIIPLSKELERKLTKAAHKNGALVQSDYFLGKNGKTIPIPKDVEGIPKSLKGKIKSHISYSPNSGGETFAHEIGHAKTINTPIVNKFQEQTRKDRRKLNTSLTEILSGEKETLSKPLDIISDFGRSKRVLHEEELANKNALKTLKTIGLDRKTLKKLKKIYKKDTKGCYGINDIVWKSKLRNLTAIKRNHA